MDRIIKDEPVDGVTEYWKNMHKMLKDEINSHPGSLTMYTPPQIADALTHIKMRDAMLRTFYDEAETLANFFNWWNDCSHWISGDLDAEQKANVLTLLAGALLLEGRWEDTESALALSIKYAIDNHLTIPHLAVLMGRSMAAGTMMGTKEDIIKLWRKSIGAVSMDEIF
jgi:hypothetical protein